jgi:NitT/TauT family transport system substrate-binding protein
LSLDDLNIRNMSSSDAGAAFVAGRVDAAVTWQPWLSRAKATSFGHVLVDSRSTPDVIVDTVAFRPRFVAEHPAAVAAFVRSYYQAIAYWRAHPAEADALMARAIGARTADYVADLQDTRLYDQSLNRQFFGTTDAPGPIAPLVTKAGAFYKALKVTDRVPTPMSIVDARFVDGTAL